MKSDWYSQPSQERKLKVKRNKTNRSKVWKTVLSDPDHQWSVAEIASATKQKPANASYHLRSLEKSGEIQRVAPGRYCAVADQRQDAKPPMTPVVVVEENPDTDEITAKLWSQVLRTEIDGVTVETLLGMRQVIETENWTFAR